MTRPLRGDAALPDQGRPRRRATSAPAQLSVGSRTAVAIAALAVRDMMLFDGRTWRSIPSPWATWHDETLADEGMTMVVVARGGLGPRVGGSVVVPMRRQVVEEGPPHRLFKAPLVPRTHNLRQDRLARQLTDFRGG